MAFPTNDFRQELGSNQEINEFLEQQFPDANFPVFGLSSLRTNPVYQKLRKQMPHQRIAHNFFKYLVDREGTAVGFYTKKQDPLTIEPEIQELLEEPFQFS